MHEPVLLNEVIEGLKLVPGMRVIDGTMGGGGHSQAILEKIGPKGRLLGLDMDATSLAKVKKRLTIYPNLFLINGRFEEMEVVAVEAGFSEVDAILLDLGFSSLQLDDPQRGFSFQQDGPLDMRLDQSARLMAAELVNKSNERTLADILYRYGELYDARRLAKALVEARHGQPIVTTFQLVKALGLSNPGVKAKVFQAFRIAVNDELGQLERVIPQAVALLKPGGRLAIISFHSLEDRIVKNSFRDNHRLKLVYKKPLVPSEQEIVDNPRSRSAKLRLAEKI